MTSYTPRGPGSGDGRAAARTEATDGRPRAGSAPADALLHLDANGLAAALGYEATIAALEAAFAKEASAPSIDRDRHELDDGELLVMPAVGREGVGVKLVTIAPGNDGRGLPLIHGVYVLFRPRSLEPEALVDGAALTALRTAGVSALATKHLARPDARRLVVFGAGAQAAAHVEAMAVVRPIERVVVVGRSAPRARALVERLRDRGFAAEVGGPEAVAEADIVCTCTTSATPVFPGELLPDGAHVNAIGAYRPDLCELEASVLARATVVVEQRAAALTEAGDLLQAIDAGAFAADDLAGELRDVVRGDVRRTDSAEVTVFKSVGLAVEDLIVARAAVARAAGPPVVA